LAFFIRLIIGPFHPAQNGLSHPALTRPSHEILSHASRPNIRPDFVYFVFDYSCDHWFSSPEGYSHLYKYNAYDTFLPLVNLKRKAAFLQP
jgi:hypothetical protein